ncbi:hypothetical protein SAMN00808754_1975 [Thermanaeromonas toyohensis ToBE]|uniref:Uncharacterized protein n=1 Tax=Thermanaeromonas toyohensis ToBE TaxID=698762 RepID=A0A1W1VX59_9FIRM|nr:hypothetical protein [Thermanaeromonas toyohensis]SMB97833.1 hypothetical protein SAMN00808754_1975 [Thermanaeromonas toyohensis ToBE]
MKPSQQFDVDTRISLTPEELEHLFHHPVMILAAEAALKDPSLAEEASEACETILDALDGYSVVASIFGCLDAIGILVANVHRKAEREAKRQTFKVFKGGAKQ